jgi:hypothetical protein
VAARRGHHGVSTPLQLPDAFGEVGQTFHRGRRQLWKSTTNIQGNTSTPQKIPIRSKPTRLGRSFCLTISHAKFSSIGDRGWKRPTYFTSISLSNGASQGAANVFLRNYHCRVTTQR